MAKKGGVKRHTIKKHRKGSRMVERQGVVKSAHAWATDDAIQAKTVLRDPAKWRGRHNRADLEGVDTAKPKTKPKARPKAKPVKSAASGGETYVIKVRVSGQDRVQTMDDLIEVIPREYVRFVDNPHHTITLKPLPRRKAEEIWAVIHHLPRERRRNSHLEASSQPALPKPQYTGAKETLRPTLHEKERPSARRLTPPRVPEQELARAEKQVKTDLDEAWVVKRLPDNQGLILVRVKPDTEADPRLLESRWRRSLGSDWTVYFRGWIEDERNLRKYGIPAGTVYLLTKEKPPVTGGKNTASYSRCKNCAYIVTNAERPVCSFSGRFLEEMSWPCRFYTTEEEYRREREEKMREAERGYRQRELVRLAEADPKHWDPWYEPGEM